MNRLFLSFYKIKSLIILVLLLHTIRLFTLSRPAVEWHLRPGSTLHKKRPVRERAQAPPPLRGRRRWTPANQTVIVRGRRPVCGSEGDVRRSAVARARRRRQSGVGVCLGDAVVSTDGAVPATLEPNHCLQRSATNQTDDRQKVTGHTNEEEPTEERVCVKEYRRQGPSDSKRSERTGWTERSTGQ